MDEDINLLQVELNKTVYNQTKCLYFVLALLLCMNIFIIIEILINWTVFKVTNTLFI